MSEYTPEDIVKYSLSGDGARVKDAIQGVLSNKVSKSLEAKRAEVAQSMFTAAGTSHEVKKPEVADTFVATAGKEGIQSAETPETVKT
jgi:hypothetical protein